MNTITNKDLRDYAWDYFSLHSDQRLKTFNFFIIIAAFLFTSFAAVAKSLGISIWLVAPMFSLSILSVVFWQLDKRNKVLVKNGEEALKQIETQLIADEVPLSLCPFINEELETKNNRQQKNTIYGYINFSYTTCFNIVFFTFGLSSFAIGSFLVFNHLCQ